MENLIRVERCPQFTIVLMTLRKGKRAKPRIIQEEWKPHQCGKGITKGGQTDFWQPLLILIVTIR